MSYDANQKHSHGRNISEVARIYNEPLRQTSPTSPREHLHGLSIAVSCACQALLHHLLRWVSQISYLLLSIGFLHGIINHESMIRQYNSPWVTEPTLLHRTKTTGFATAEHPKYNYHFETFLYHEATIIAWHNQHTMHICHVVIGCLIVETSHVSIRNGKITSRKIIR